MSVHGVSGEVEVICAMNQYFLKDQGPALKWTKTKKLEFNQCVISVIEAATPSKILASTQIFGPTLDLVINRSLVTYWKDDDLKLPFSILWVLQARLRDVFQNMCLIFHTYPPKGYASKGVFMWSWSSIIPWLPWFSYLPPQLLASPLICHPSCDHWETHLHSFSGQWMMQDEALGGHICAVSRCKVDWAIGKQTT